MANDKKADVVMSFKSDGEVKLNQTIKELNAVMNTAAKQYRAQMAAMNENASSSDKLAAEQKKLSIQYEASQKRTEKLTEEYKRMKAAGTANAVALAKQAGKVADAERAESSLKKQLDNANKGLTEQGKKSLEAKDKLASLQKESEQLDRKQKDLISSFKLEQSELRKNATETEKNNLKKKELTKQIHLTREQVKNLEQQLQASEQAYGSNSKEAGKLRNKLDQAKASENNFSKELEATNKALRKQGNMSDKAAERIQKIKHAGEKLKSVGTTISAGVTTPIIGLGAASVKAFSDLRGAEAEVIRQTGATGKSADELRQSFERIHEQSPADMETVGQALGGVHTEMSLTGKAAEAAALQFMKYAKVNKQDVAQSVTDVSRMMGDAGIKSSDYGKVLDQLTVASQKSGINVSELAQSCTKFGAPMRALGVDTQHSIAMFSAWHKAGVNTDIAFSGMKKAISQWGKQGKDSGQEFQKTLEKIKGAPTIADATSLAIKNFGAKAGPDLADAIKGGRFEISQYTDALKNSSGQLNKTAKESANPTAKMKVAMNQISDAGAKLGEVIVTSVVPTLTQVVKHVTKWATAFKKLSPHTKKLIIDVSLFVAAVGPFANSPIVNKKNVDKNFICNILQSHSISITN